MLDQAKMMAAIMKEPDLMMFTDDTTLSSLLSPDDAAAVDRGARRARHPAVQRRQDEAVDAVGAWSRCRPARLARKAGGAPVLDVKLAEDAKASGKKLEGLETVADQLARDGVAADGTSIMKGLVDTLKLGDRMDDVIETMIVLYARGDTGMFWPLFRAVLPGDDERPGRLCGVREDDGHRAQQDDGRAAPSRSSPRATPSSRSARCICPAPKGWSSCSARPGTRSPLKASEVYSDTTWASIAGTMIRWNGLTIAR